MYFEWKILRLTVFQIKKFELLYFLHTEFEILGISLETPSILNLICLKTSISKLLL